MSLGVMTVLASSKRAQTTRRPRRWTPGRVSEDRVTAPELPVREPATRAAAPERRRREQGPPQDEALYTCSCGFVFHAAVSTSVGCPHCGDTQAW
jgi:hypothetical protein